MQKIGKHPIVNVLNREYLSRSERNSRYSMRAFARSLSIDPSLLLRVMRGERSPSENVINLVSDQLDLAPDTVARLHARSKESKVKQKKLGKPQFKPIAKWYFFAILDLFLLPDFKSNENWMAKKLGLPVTIINASLPILEEAGHIFKEEDQWVLNTASSTWVDYNKTNYERKSFQKQILSQGIKAIDEVEFDLRESASLSLPANSNLLPIIKSKIQLFKDDIRKLIEAEGNYDEVYQLYIGYFPLTRPVHRGNDEE